MQTFVFDSAVWAMLIMALWAAISDLRTGLIQNHTVACGALCGLAAQLAALPAFGAAQLGAVALRLALSVFLCSLVPLLLWLRGGLGGGDVKLFVAIGVCVGPLLGLEVQLTAFLLAFFMLPVQLVLRGQLRATLVNSWRLLCNLLRPARAGRPLDQTASTALRFAPAIFGAALFVVLRNAVTP